MIIQKSKYTQNWSVTGHFWNMYKYFLLTLSWLLWINHIHNLRIKFVLHNFTFCMPNCIVNYCRYPDLLENLNSSNSNNKVCSYYIIFHVPKACLVSCDLLKNATILWLFFFFSWQFITNKWKSCSQDWIILFFFIFSFTYLIPYSVFCFMIFLLQQDFVNCRNSANFKILKTKVNMTVTGFEPQRSILIRVANLQKGLSSP